jgi:hypothetical protein
VAGRPGQRVRCEVRGKVRIVGLSEGRISWPVGIKGSNRALVVCKGLAKAVHRESAQAVAHWWGVHRQTGWARRPAARPRVSVEGR